MASSGLDIVCFSANDWDDIPSSKLHLMRYLGARNRVLFVDTIGIRSPGLNSRDARRIVKKARAIAGGIRQVTPNIHVLSPPALPFHGNAVARSLNERLVAAAVRAAMRKVGMRRPLIWSYLPHAAPIIARLPCSRIVYHCIDDYSAVTGAASGALQVAERAMCRDADLVAASSTTLTARCVDYGANALYVPHAVDPDFGAAVDPRVQMHDIDALPRPRAGFVGRIGDWIDLELIARAARDLPSWSFPLVGPSIVDTAIFDDCPNVVLLGRKEYEAVPNYLDRFDVAMIPYRGSANRETRNPLKLYEYLAAGKPVVATEIREAERFADVVSTTAPENFARALSRAVETDSDELRDRRRAAVGKRSWADVAEEILSALNGRSVRVVA